MVVRHGHYRSFSFGPQAVGMDLKTANDCDWQPFDSATKKTAVFCLADGQVPRAPTVRAYHPWRRSTLSIDIVNIRSCEFRSGGILPLPAARCRRYGTSRRMLKPCGYKDKQKTPAGEWFHSPAGDPFHSSLLTSSRPAHPPTCSPVDDIPRRRRSGRRGRRRRPVCDTDRRGRRRHRH